MARAIGLMAGHTQQESSGLRNQEWLGPQAPNTGLEKCAPAKGQRPHGLIGVRPRERAPMGWMFAASRWETLRQRTLRFFFPLHLVCY